MNSLHAGKEELYLNLKQKLHICWQQCETLVLFCIGSEKYNSVINVCRDTTEICSLCMKFEKQSSGFLPVLSELCSKICYDCSSQLRKYQDTDSVFLETIIA